MEWELGMVVAETVQVGVSAWYGCGREIECRME